MSPREQAQNRIVIWLNTHSHWFNAPYGIIDGISELPTGGKVRTITFGVSRWLDCGLTIWSEKRISVNAQGSMARQFKPVYHSVDELIGDLEKMVS